MPYVVHIIIIKRRVCKSSHAKTVHTPINPCNHDVKQTVSYIVLPYFQLKKHTTHKYIKKAVGVTLAIKQFL